MLENNFAPPLLQTDSPLLHLYLHEPSDTLRVVIGLLVDFLTSFCITTSGSKVNGTVQRLDVLFLAHTCAVVTTVSSLHIWKGPICAE